MMAEISLHLMDLIENSISAGASMVELYIYQNRKKDFMIITIIDNGKGMSDDVIERAQDPLFSTKEGKNWGLGIPLFKQTAEMCDGFFRINSIENRFTKVEVGMKLSHIDRPPMGDLVGTIISVILGHPDLDFSLFLDVDGAKYNFSTKEVREVLGEVPLISPEVIKYLEKDLKEAILDIAFID